MKGGPMWADVGGRLYAGQGNILENLGAVGPAPEVT